MRITQNFSDRKYLKNSSKLLSGYTKSMLKIESQMDYFRASDNAINASKAMTVRKNLQDLSMYDSNLKLTKGLYEAAEQNRHAGEPPGRRGFPEQQDSGRKRAEHGRLRNPPADAVAAATHRSAEREKSELAQEPGRNHQCGNRQKLPERSRSGPFGPPARQQEAE